MKWGNKDKVGSRHPVVLCGPEEMLWLCREGKITEPTFPDVSQAVRMWGLGNISEGQSTGQEVGAQVPSTQPARSGGLGWARSEQMVGKEACRCPGRTS